MTKTRESVFNSLHKRTKGAVFVDLFAAAGGMGIEALSRGASAVHFVEMHPDAVRCLRENLSALRVDAERGVIHQCDALAFLTGDLDAATGGTANIVWADPPYDSDAAALVVAHFDATTHDGLRMLVVEHRGSFANQDFLRLHIRREKSFGDTTVTFFEPNREDGA